MRTTILAFFFVAGLTTSVHAVGSVEYFEFYSDSLSEMRTVSIYLPDGYDQDTRSYPVIHCLHGCVCGTYDPHWAYWTALGLQNYLDINIENETIQPVIVVLPDACGGDFCGSYYTDSELYGLYEQYIVNEVVNYVDDHYRTIATREFRLLMGHSMGGDGAMRLALKHPDRFGAAASHAGVLDYEVCLEVQRDGVLEGYPEGPPYEYDPVTDPVMFARAGAWSPNLQNPPYFVDFPYDEVGDIDPSVRERWRLQNSTHHAREFAATGSELCIWFDAGTGDYGRVEMNQAFADTLDVLGIPYQFEIHGGGHNILRWFSSLGYLLNPEIPCGLVEVSDVPPDANVTMRVLPNPSRSSATFEFTLSQTEQVSLTVYDISGRVVRSVFDVQLEAGPHSRTWDGTSDAGGPVADGVYFVALRTSTGTEVMRTVRLK